MRYVVIRSEPTGNWLDPRPYLAIMHSIGEDLPPGARAFAASPGHYDFYSTECIKDLHLASVERGSAGSVTVRFSANRWQHERGLELIYRDIKDLTLDPAAESIGSHGSVLLDELLPSRAGFEHEVALTKGVLRVTAGDVDAEWV